MALVAGQSLGRGIEEPHDVPFERVLRCAASIAQSSVTTCRSSSARHTSQSSSGAKLYVAFRSEKQQIVAMLQV